MPTSAIIIIIGSIIAWSVGVFSIYLNKKKLTTEISKLKFSIILFASLIVCILIISLIFSWLMSDDTSFWSICFGHFKSPQFIFTCFLFIAAPVFNRLYFSYRQKKAKQQEK
jgi:hypothetical protein